MRLSVKDVSVSYPGFTAVSHVDLDVMPGSVVAIVGPNGCGKSTLLRSMARLHRPDSGQIRLDGQDVWAMRATKAARHIALLPQNPLAPEAITVRGLVAFGRHPHQGLFRQWSQADSQAADRALHDAGVAELADRTVETLSGGQRQRCWLAMTLAQQTPVLLLDEPTSALDLGHATETLQVVREVAAAGRSVVMVIHDLGAAARHADVLVAMRDGQIVASGAPGEIVDSHLVRTLYEIDAHILRAPDDGAPVVVPAANGTAPPDTPLIWPMGGDDHER